MCDAMPGLVKYVGPEQDQTRLLGELYELLADEQSSVRFKALNALTTLLPSLSISALENSALPVIKKYLQPRDLEPDMQIALARLFGKLTVEVTLPLSLDVARYDQGVLL